MRPDRDEDGTDGLDDGLIGLSVAQERTGTGGRRALAGEQEQLHIVPEQEQLALAAALRDDPAGQRDDAAEQRDEVAEHRDVIGEQRDHAAATRDRAADFRDDAAERRDRAADLRDDAAELRDRAAELRDQAAEQRDRSGDLRDQAADRSEARFSAQVIKGGTGVEATTHALDRSALDRREAASDRRRASLDRRAGARERIQSELDRSTALADRGDGATQRTEAELDRYTAMADRGAGAAQRTEAESDRDVALADRGESARGREYASVDGLTGVYLRGAGFMELERQIARARRTNESLVLAFVDVDGLKAINDSFGHAAGDRMLVRVGNTLRAKLRSYDLIIRYGGDEFVCGLLGLSLAAATQRLTLVNTALAREPEPGSVTVGLAQLQPDDARDDLIARADAALYRTRQRRTSA